MEENDGDFAVFVYIWTVNKEFFTNKVTMYGKGNKI